MSEKKLEIRRATVEDADSILTITKKAFLKYIKLAQIENVTALNETIEDVINDINNKLVWIAIYDGIPVGSVRVEVFSDKTAYFSRFGVAPDHQSNGLGGSLFDVVNNEMRSMGITQLSLHTASKASSLIRFYYNNGFYIDSTTKDRGYIRALLCKEY